MAENNTGTFIGRNISYMSQLDALRAIAVFGVFLVHYTQIDIIHNIGTGWIGVRLFFVLSGFLISLILIRVREDIRTGKSSWRFSLKRFYIRRFLRIFPVYYLFIVVLFIFNIVPIRESFYWHISYLSNVYFAHIDKFWGNIGPFWTLAVEEQFYLIWPLLILTIPKRYLQAVIISAIIIGPVFRLFGLASGLSIHQVSVLTPGCIDALAVGGLLAYGWSYNSALCNWLVSSGLYIALPASIYLIYIDGFIELHIELLKWIVVAAKQLFVSLAFVTLIDRTARGFSGLPKRILEFKPLRYCGKISYGLYLFHAPMIDLVRMGSNALGIAEPFDLAGFVVKLTLTFGIAVASWHLFERPINRLKRYFPYTPRDLQRDQERMARQSLAS